MYIKIENNVPAGSPIDQWELFSRFSNTSFVIPITPEDLDPFGYGVIQYTPKPVADKYEVCVEDIHQKDESSGYWVQTWKMVPMTQSEKDEVDATKSAEVRAERNKRLLDCDWTQLPDSTVDKQAWATYRQALRDLTDQVGFPWAVGWPAKPQ